MRSNRQKMHDADAERARQNIPEPTGLWRVPGACNAHNAPRQKSQEPALPIGAGQGKVELAACDRHESDASAGRSRAMRVATLAMVRGWWARKETRKSCKISKCPGLRRNTWQWREPARPTDGRNDAHA